jgi:hypothetical protein
MPEMTLASADKTTSATVADVRSITATAATHPHRTTAGAAIHVGAASMHPAAGMHPAAATTATAMAGERYRRDEKACCNCSDQSRFTYHLRIPLGFGQKRHLGAGTHSHVWRVNGRRSQMVQNISLRLTIAAEGSKALVGA